MGTDDAGDRPRTGRVDRWDGRGRGAEGPGHRGGLDGPGRVDRTPAVPVGGAGRADRGLRWVRDVGGRGRGGWGLVIRGWRGRSRQVRVELFPRWTLYSLPWIMLVVMGGPVPNRLRLDPPANG